MSSFGHRIGSATQRDRDLYNLPRTWALGVSPPCGCFWPKCRKPEVVYVCSYRYVTGRAGRVSVNEKFYCEAHGRKFATKHGLEAPDPSIVGVSKSASEQRSQFIQTVIGS